MISFWVEVENSKDLPSYSELCTSVSKAAQAGRWARLVAKKLSKGAVRFWSWRIEEEGLSDSLFENAISYGLLDQCNSFNSNITQK